MGAVLAGIRLGIVGGDKRIEHFIPRLVEAGAVIYGVGLRKLPLDIIQCGLKRAVRECHVLILPMNGCSAEGVVQSEYDDEPVNISQTRHVRQGVLVLTGTIPPKLQEIGEANKWNLVAIAQDDELAILNSIPTAEGAVRLAQERSSRTIHGSRTLVLGMGRCGTTLAHLLKQMGSTVDVACRLRRDLARAVASGYNPFQFTELEHSVSKSDFIFNTVPSRVLSERILAKTKEDVVIVDIASAPGGVDFCAAQKLKRMAVLAPSIPGRFTPQTAGRCLGKVLPRLIVQNLRKGDNNER